MARAKRVTGLAADAPTSVNARAIVRARLDELLEWDASVDEPYRVQELHNLRIAAKRLRYSLEIFLPVLSEDLAPLIKEVEQVQEELGNLHDTDVMIALLRLCLGSMDGGSAYERLLTHAAKAPGRFIINPALVAHLADPDGTPSAQERAGLEMLLSSLQQQRTSFYTTFRQHWYQMKGQDFRRTLLDRLDVAK